MKWKVEVKAKVKAERDEANKRRQKCEEKMALLQRRVKDAEEAAKAAIKELDYYKSAGGCSNFACTKLRDDLWA